MAAGGATATVAAGSVVLAAGNEGVMGIAAGAGFSRSNFACAASRRLRSSSNASARATASLLGVCSATGAGAAAVVVCVVDCAGWLHAAAATNTSRIGRAVQDTQSIIAEAIAAARFALGATVSSSANGSSRRVKSRSAHQALGELAHFFAQTTPDSAYARFVGNCSASGSLDIRCGRHRRAGGEVSQSARRAHHARQALWLFAGSSR